MAALTARQRRELVALRKDASAVIARIAAAKQRGWSSAYEAMTELAVAEAMCQELALRLHELTAGHQLPRPTAYEVRLLFEARRRLPS